MRTPHRARGFLKPASLRWATRSTFDRFRGRRLLDATSCSRPADWSVSHDFGPDSKPLPYLVCAVNNSVHATSCDRATASDLVAFVRRIDDKAIDAGISVRDQCNKFM